MTGRNIRTPAGVKFSPLRRRVLRAGIAAGSLFLPVPYAWVWAQSEGTLKLLRLPKLALVVGNSKYKEAPLKNPANDARAIGEMLQQTGFEVTVKLDAGRTELSAAVQAYVQELARRKSVGLFYFAGHGLQLAWRNYMLPVDADLDTVADIPRQAVEVGGLLEGIGRAANPLNVIILDACRDNPFGGLKGVDHKGLSQMDAPLSTLLAYATSPGNTASDGDGVNGLYTENLLKEIRVPEAKIEDVFKRVRLHVRRRSNGQQIPWESTSLEDDFYFVPPRSLSTLSAEEAESERRQEMVLREKRRAEEKAERKHQQELALREARLAAEEAERRRQQELALLKQQHIAEEAERKRRNESALKEAQRVAEAAERKRREEQALREAKLAEEEAARKYQQELARREQRRAEDAAERKRKEEQALSEVRLAEEDAARKYQQELALREKQRAQDEAERRRKQEPASIRKPDAALAERQFEEELAIWERIKASMEAAPLEDYLLRYPSGRFSELAQFQLDRVLARKGEKKIEITSSQGNPFTKGTARIDTNFKVGDSYHYREIDLFTKLETQKIGNRITEITEDQVRFNDGRLVTDLFGNLIRAGGGNVFTGAQFFIPDYAIGKKWATRYRITYPKGGANEFEVDFRVIARERITVPAGAFEAFHVEGKGWGRGDRGSLSVKIDYWIAPGIRRPVASEDYRRGSGGRVIANERRELTAYLQQ